MAFYRPKTKTSEGPENGASSSANEMKGRRIGRILTKMGKVTREQVHEALELQQKQAQKGQRRLIGQLLVELGYVKEADVNAALAAQTGIEVVTLDPNKEIPEAVLAILPAESVKAYQVLPLEFNEKKRSLTVALKDPGNVRAVDDLRILTNFDVRPVVADPAIIEQLINKYYAQKTEEESLSNLIGELESDEQLEEFKGRGESIDMDQLMQAADDNKVKRLLNLVLMQAIKDRASDIHFEPFEDEFKMRYRIDGVLYEMVPPPRYLAMPIVSRIKVMANLDIGERRLPQDGRIELTIDKRPVDLRVAVLPTMYGESVVMRVLDRGNVALDLDKLGMRREDMDVFRQLIGKPNGIVLVTGPTGSGKTTTLYSALRELNSVDTKILTVEDPVEYDIDGLCQVQVRPEVGLTFASALRSFLRQDPDIILVGETRDLETAEIASQASLTGHLVFTTLHTNDAPSSIARLLDLGLEPFLLTATLEGIVAQRLVRRICSKCKESYSPSEEQLMELQLTPDDVQGRVFYHGKGCDACNHSGYRGRLGVYEIMVLDDDLREIIMQHGSTQLLRAEARKRGMRSLRQAGLLAIYDGQTTIDEVVRETLSETE
ncbi:MAG: Flp pilus assembly complex ATPase component TadA [Phycisphaeraceae bacterium]|nr:Flp pilus assembly complex ATPase component TadA [Phycisphaeraceae bacterium]